MRARLGFSVIAHLDAEILLFAKFSQLAIVHFGVDQRKGF